MLMHLLTAQPAKQASSGVGKMDWSAAVVNNTVRSDLEVVNSKREYREFRFCLYDTCSLHSHRMVLFDQEENRRLSGVGILWHIVIVQQRTWLYGKNHMITQPWTELFIIVLSSCGGPSLPFSHTEYHISISRTDLTFTIDNFRKGSGSLDSCLLDLRMGERGLVNWILEFGFLGADCPHLRF